MWLEKYRGYEVEILYLTDNTTFSDRGRLTDFSDQWVELTKEGGWRRQGEVLVVPTTAIRILKVLSAPETAEHTLLRPAAVDDEPIQPKP